MEPSFTLRPANPQDDLFLFELYASTRQDELNAWGWEPAQQAAFLQMQFKAQQWQYQGQFPQAEHALILDGERLVGRILVDEAPDELRLVDIALLPGWRGRGIGTSLLRDLQARAARAGKPLRLHVLKSNPAADLYRRLEFTVTDDDGLYLQMEWKDQ